jgi:archaellum biogenesis protein FlaJ (TadC family)
MYYQRKNVTVIKNPPPQYMNAIEKLKRYEKIAKAAPMLATLAALALSQVVYAATPSIKVCIPFIGCWERTYCFYIGPVQVCIT